MTNDFDDLEAWAKEVVESLSPAERAKALRRIGKVWRDNTRKRLQNQEGPDGTKWAARKDGSRKKMFQRLKLARNLKVKSSTQHVSLGWSGRAGGVARVHHSGLTERMNGRGVKVKYERRSLLGISQDDRDSVNEVVTDMISGD